MVTYSVSPTGDTVYLNGGTLGGGSQATTAYSNTPSLEPGTTFATIGNQRALDVTQQFLGEIDDVRIYNTALTATPRWPSCTRSRLTA